MRNTERVKKVEKDGSGNHLVTTMSHPAFGILRLSKPSGNKVLFGSEIDHREYVQFSIVPATLDRGLHNNWFHGENRPIVEFSMSHAQFTSMLSSSGNYTGTPITFDILPKTVNKETYHVPSIEYMEKQIDMNKYEIESNIKAEIEKINNKFIELKDSIEEKKGIKLQRELLHTLSCLVKNLPANLKFGVDQAKVNIDEIKHTALVEVDAMISRHIQESGLTAIQNKQIYGELE